MNFRDYASAVRLYEMSLLDRAIQCLFWFKNVDGKNEATAREIADLIAQTGLPDPNVTRLAQIMKTSRRIIRGRSKNKWRLHAATSEELRKVVGHFLVPSAAAPTASAIPVDVPFFSRADVTLAKKMSDIYILLNCLENSTRNLIRARLEAAHGDNWWDQVKTREMDSKVNDRTRQEARNRWHQPRGRHPLNYLDFGDLKDLICNNWIYFRDVFPDQNWVITRLTELERSRNVVAHNNVLEDIEISRIQLYFGDWCRQVGGIS